MLSTMPTMKMASVMELSVRAMMIVGGDDDGLAVFPEAGDCHEHRWPRAMRTLVRRARNEKARGTGGAASREASLEGHQRPVTSFLLS